MIRAFRNIAQPTSTSTATSVSTSDASSTLPTTYPPPMPLPTFSEDFMDWSSFIKYSHHGAPPKSSGNALVSSLLRLSLQVRASLDSVSWKKCHLQNRVFPLKTSRFPG